MSNPYLVTGPALISFSGGRTSGYMLKHILDAHGGTLPDDVHVCFANTGKEREETLRFVHECATRWNVRVRWLEWVDSRKRVPVAKRFTEVAYNSASRAGEPFERLIELKKAVPNPLKRWCTQELKVNTLRHFMEAQGYQEWTNVVGLRWDEMRRVFKQFEQNEAATMPWRTVMPMATRVAPVRQRNVLSFWKDQPFDLGITGWQGNCDLCFLKQEQFQRSIIRDNPTAAKWWDKMEQKVGSKFNFERSYRDILNRIEAAPLLPLEIGDDNEFDAECGLWCAGEAA